ncbi:uncharacterized protein LOC128740832 [Sabethes cyaneus]|uniref:uncharacterized protein LOC128740832 n=1 Tax=Sabethes cyaneus TaxID=53552 RepID=UPI00237E061A|nr:uncharacterized protein LOC128740832 [Sabethes cyaneus]
MFYKNPLLSTLLLFCTIYGQTSSKGIKQKRLLYDLADPFVSVTEPAPFYHPTTFHPPAPVYSSDAPILNQVIKPIPSAVPPFHPKPSLLNLYKSNYFDYSNYGAPFHFVGSNQLGFSDEETYIADGRILKQYSVLEHHPEDVERHRLLQPTPSYFQHNLPPLFDLPISSAIGFNPRLGLPLNQSPLLTKNHGPVALGSGSLGYIHGPNGVVFGSGSLGYISHQQHRNSLSEIVARRSRKLRPGPLHFGHNHD